MKKIIKKHSLQQGFSIVELMIALVISVATIGGLFSIYLSTRQSQDLTEANSRIQEGARFALQYLKRDIRMIGYRGCVSNQVPITNVLAKSFPSTYDPLANELVGFHIQSGWESGTLFASSTNITSRIKNGTDAILVARMASTGAELAERQSDASANIKVNASSSLSFKQNDIVYISDCINADIFAITNNPNTQSGLITITHANSNNIRNNLSKAYQSNANIARYQANFYFIGDTNRTNRDGSTIYALYQAELDYSTSPMGINVNELIDGVENMRILYGEKLATGNIKYTTSNLVSDMNNVSSIQLGMLMASTNNVRKTDDTQTYYIAQQQVQPDNGGSADKRLRHAFNSTIQIRNRGL